MIKMILKKTLILSLPILGFGVNAAIVHDREALAKQCQELSRTVASLVSSQQKSTCVDKLVLASVQIDTAGAFIIDDAIPAAKQHLDDSIYALQYAELNSCNRYIQISHSKFEAQRIKNSL